MRPALSAFALATALATGLGAALAAVAPVYQRQPWAPEGTLAAATTARLALAAERAAAQEREYPFTPYDGRFIFVRIFFEAQLGSFGRFRGGGEPPWHHDYPYAERNLTSILAEISRTRAYTGGGNVFSLKDPELFRFPAAWLAEPGQWNPTDEEAALLGAYLRKGGFIIFDDFDGPDLDHLVRTMERVLPGLRPIRLDGTEPIFRAFFEVQPYELQFQSYRASRGQPEQYWGYFEDNDRTRRQIAILNHNNDIGEFMEYSATGFSAVNMANEAYKLGVNYILYAMTH
ncbi:MAG TPA: DUF4159 domain-containing protein [Longimicrobiales bacterium]|nr:DUF4159 domain-containing protein [Longimicrobiales bacterium]